MSAPSVELTPVQRAWVEYLAWTCGAAEGQYEVTEALAWQRLQAAVLRAAVVPVTLEPPTDDQESVSAPS